MSYWGLVETQGGSTSTWSPAVVTRPLVVDALRAVNALRQEWDLPALAEMPRGIRGDAHNCPVARALGVYSVVPDTRCAYYRLEPGGVSLALSPLLSEFAIAFDQGGYPELEARS